jgi:hypothetical protein
MKSDGVDSWLRHWLKLQKKNKRPLVFKDLSDKPSDPNAPPQVVSKGKKKASQTQYVDSDDEEEVDDDEEMDDDGEDSISHPAVPSAPPIDTGTKAKVGDHIKSLPKCPSSAARNRTSRRTFLTSLSDDKNYKDLLLLLKAADVSTS